MRALCVLHDHVSSAGYVGDRLREHGWQVEDLLVVPPDRFGRPDVRCDFPDPGEYDLIVPLGAPWSVYDDATIGTWVADELGWLAKAVGADVAVLGICFGAQALARSAGAQVRRAAQPEIGWVSISSDEPDLISSGPWFQWHYDSFTVPEDATELARNPAAIQAYELGRSLAVQFHPELTPQGLDEWLSHGGDAKAREAGLDPDALRQETAATATQARARAYALVDAFLLRSFGPGALLDRAGER